MNEAHGIQITSNDFETGWRGRIVGYGNQGGQVMYVSKEIIMQTIEPYMAVTGDNGTFHISEENAHMLMDKFWAAGVRPSGYLEPRGQIAAMNKHIDDLRVVAKIIKPRMPEPGV